MTPKRQSIKEKKFGKLDHIKLNNPALQDTLLSEWKDKLHTWGKYFQNHISEKGSVHRIYKTQNITMKRQTTQLRKDNNIHPCTSQRCCTDGKQAEENMLHISIY